MSHEHTITTGDGVSTALPIAAYGLLADCNTAALVGIDGSIDWLCLPRSDSPSVFARILDPDAGHWSIRPASSYQATRRYVPGTLLIETTFSTTEGAVRLTDGFAFAEGQRGHELGLNPPHELVRLVEGLTGRVELGRATELFDRVVGYANDLGLLAEEMDAGTGELLGNFPQAFSHVGLTTAAWDLDRCGDPSEAEGGEE